MKTSLPKGPLSRKGLRLAVLAFALTGLTACNALQRMADVGSAPKLAQVENPVKRPEYQPVSMPMPAPMVAEPNANSLWRPGARTFFKDQRAGDVGDILTVIVNISGETASLSNTTERKRENPAESATLPSLLGYETKLDKVFPVGVSATDLVSFGSNSAYKGSGSISRSETIAVNLAATITQVLPNGNLVVAGKQQILVNNELRQVTVTGVVRPEDISSLNQVNWDKIAEARITYGGRGTLSDVQQPRYGQQIFDIIFPF